MVSSIMELPPSDQGSETGEVDFRDYLVVLSRYRWTIIVVTALAVAVGVGASIVLPRTYVAGAEVALEQPVVEALLGENVASGTRLRRSAQTEARVIQSETVKTRVDDELGFVAPRAVASVVGDSEVIRITVKDSDAEQAALITNTYAVAYIELRRSQYVDDLAIAAEQTRQRIEELQADIEALGRAASASPSPDADLERFQLISRQTQLRQQLSQLEVGRKLSTGGARIVTQADPPDEASGLTLPLALALSLVVGVMAGVGVAFGRNYFDDAIRDRRDLAKAIEGVPVLGVVPRVVESGSSLGPAMLGLPAGPTAEAVRALRTAVAFRASEGKVRELQVTSAKGRDGKTAIAVDLAVAFAQTGTRILLVDADLREPRVHEFFALPNEAGLRTVVGGTMPLQEAISEVTGVPGLSILTSGPPPEHPAEFLASADARGAIDRLRAGYDLVIIDSPPVTPVTDACVLAGTVDGLLLVAAVGRTTASDVREALTMLGQVEAPVLGTILNV